MPLLGGRILWSTCISIQKSEYVHSLLSEFSKRVKLELKCNEHLRSPRESEGTHVHSQFILIPLFSKIHYLKSEHINSLELHQPLNWMSFIPINGGGGTSAWAIIYASDSGAATICQDGAKARVLEGTEIKRFVVECHYWDGVGVMWNRAIF